ncbi:hypothetical protein AMELA_G00128990 [Ameiurus melas]|uniref:Uncharacterized protein n=1 Tax=Ameiurus melas TaxID=219545 RepID=A0A7J6ASG7_AMEME|nr:hypothetical protein AMELA_G00128990 [Ameiurus melas]
MAGAGILNLCFTQHSSADGMGSLHIWKGIINTERPLAASVRASSSRSMERTANIPHRGVFELGPDDSTGIRLPVKAAHK